MTEEIYIYYVDHLPIDAMVTPCPEGYTIYLNKKLLLNKQKAIKKYRHELQHILCRDWEKDDIQSIETDRHEEE